MHLKIPPPVQALVVIVAMWAINRALPQYALNFEYQAWISGIFVICGLLSAFSAVIKFKQSDTQIDPRDPTKTSALVVVGMFRFTRNPMYLGLLLVLTGFMIWWGNPVNIVPVLLFVWYITRYQIAPEEAVLQEKFGADYEAYRRKVRRWI